MVTMKEKILFLDFDGPLFSNRIIRYHPGNTYMNPAVKFIRDQCERIDPVIAQGVSYAYMDPASVGILNRLQDYHKFYTVISSTWRSFMDKRGVLELFKLNDLDLVLHDDWCTPFSNSCVRMGDIYQWCSDRRGADYYDWIIIDDISSGTTLGNPYLVEELFGEGTSERVVMVDEEIGLVPKHYIRMDKVWNSTKIS